jgi:hypothetical protein
MRDKQGREELKILKNLLAGQKGLFNQLAQFLGPLFLVGSGIRTHAQPQVGLDGNVSHGIHSMA